LDGVCCGREIENVKEGTQRLKMCGDAYAKN